MRRSDPWATCRRAQMTSNNYNVCCRPYGNVGDIYDFQSDGIFKQTQVIVGVNSQVGQMADSFWPLFAIPMRTAIRTAWARCLPILTISLPTGDAPHSDIEHNLFLGRLDCRALGTAIFAVYRGA